MGNKASIDNSLDVIKNTYLLLEELEKEYPTVNRSESLNINIKILRDSLYKAESELIAVNDVIPELYQQINDLEQALEETNYGN